jgi:hypothetical protein
MIKSVPCQESNPIKSHSSSDQVILSQLMKSGGEDSRVIGG